MARKTTTTGVSKPRGPRVTRPAPRPKRISAEKTVQALVAEAAPKPVAKVVETVAPAAKAAPVSPKPAPVAAPVSEPVAVKAAVEKAASVVTAGIKEVAATVSAVTEAVLPKASPAPISKGTFTMATATAPEKIQTMFTDLSDRAKTAFEKSTKLSEEFADLTKGNLEAIAESAKIAAKNAEALAQEAADYSKKNFETATSALKRYSAVKSPAELLQLNGEFAKTSFDTTVSELSKVSETLTKMMGDIFQPLSNRYTVASEKIKAASAF
jgi:phasin family protein